MRRRVNEEFNPRNTLGTIKHGGGTIKVWGCFSYNGVGPIFWKKENMTKEIYLQILETIMLHYAEENMPLQWVYQQDNDPKHTARCNEILKIKIIIFSHNIFVFLPPVAILAWLSGAYCLSL